MLEVIVANFIALQLSRGYNMTASKKLTLSADGTSATVADATITDIFTTAISSNETVTGLYGLAQKAGLFVGGMALQNSRLGNGINPFK